METKIKIGQIWSVKNEENGKAFIFDLDKENEIVHFAYLKNDEAIIFHIPINYSLFIQSIFEYTGDKKITPDFFDAKRVWEENSGGVWDIGIQKIIDMTLKDI
ncbi:hypothetical protein [Chryseobacterium sp. ERMR1:04]|uniref:hypothetical protein n=1 Tax=Chryseobacterium sp. ERMR1:04 TaxID=1705393 RepID=UPI0006C858EE|nr:hypothetical protein [Chryseobacterium sp. ERMR1:04]KPH14069.1 hypothetical protein AMQ68_00645 [Chryseobacterium sp. ERMR1:04]